MTGQPNISKSVRRTFDVLELFCEQRRPMTAAQIQHALGLPQPSARVLLKELLDVGYLSYTMPARTYFPTARLRKLSDWLGSSLTVNDTLIPSIDAVATAVDETVALATATYGHVEVLYANRAQHPLALQVQAGMGGCLWRSAPGRTLLSMRSEAEVDAFFADIDVSDAPRGRALREEVRRQIRSIREEGCFAGYDILMKGVGSMCLPLTGLACEGTHLVVTVAGGKDRIKSAERQILKTLRTQLRDLLA
ncbi:MAG: helix-turn-helix domain-containing protein [Gammaproteobacteria bacterium]|nr:helix-turn-helix domain-containing protein [Gammaproteobacteria bacterium]